MNISTESQHTLSAWVTALRSRAQLQQSGHFTALDGEHNPLVIEWNITDILSPDLAAFKKEVCEIAAHTHAASEVQFLQAHPEAVSQDPFLKSCEPLFETSIDSVEWKEVEERIKSTYKQFYLMDIAQFGADIIKKIADDLYVIATIKEAPSLKNHESEKIVGCMMAAVTPALAYGDIKLIKLALAPANGEYERGELLVSTLFKVIPGVQRIFSSIRPTDKDALQAYFSWGFTHDHNPVQDPNHPLNLEHSTVVEYKADQSDRLQKTAKTLII